MINITRGSSITQGTSLCSVKLQQEIPLGRRKNARKVLPLFTCMGFQISLLGQRTKGRDEITSWSRASDIRQRLVMYKSIQIKFTIFVFALLKTVTTFSNYSAVDSTIDILLLIDLQQKCTYTRVHVYALRT